VVLNRTAPAPKLVPNLTVTFADVNPLPLMTTRVPPATVPVFGDTVNAAAAAVMVNVTELLVWPPAVTVTLRAVVAAVGSMVKVVVSCVVLVTVAVPTVTPVPLTLTVVPPDTKFVPVIVIETPVAPAAAEFCEIFEIVGTVGVGVGVGLGAANIVKFTVFESTPPGFLTPTVAEPGITGRVNVTVIVPELTTDPPTAEPLKSTAAPLANLEPLTVRVTLVPAVPDDGETPDTTGVKGCTVRVAVPEVPPPGPAFDT
jgi:hypothetical protein